jgi:hypothetical protein
VDTPTFLQDLLQNPADVSCIRNIQLKFRAAVFCQLYDLLSACGVHLAAIARERLA